IEVTASTMGQGNPSHVGEGNWYRWNGDPGKSEAAIGTTSVHPGGSQPSPERVKRLEEFARLRDEEKLSVAEAGERLGVKATTARTYARELRALRRAAP